MLAMFESKNNNELRVIQYGDLVFDNFEMLRLQSTSIDVKESTTRMQFHHGSYFAWQQSNHLYEDRYFSMTVNLNLRKLLKHDRFKYRIHVLKELSRPQLVWATDGYRLLFGRAYVESIGETLNQATGTFTLNLDIVMYDGVWKVARSREVFLSTYEVCDFMDCIDIRMDDRCSHCCDCSNERNPDTCSCTCRCDYFVRERSLCELGHSILDLVYKNCTGLFRIHLNCQLGRVFDLQEEATAVICKQESCDPYVLGIFRNESIIETRDVTIIIDGHVFDPVVKLGNEWIRIQGEYDGLLTINPDFTVTYCLRREGDYCLNDTSAVVPQENITFSRFMWRLEHGSHSFRIEQRTGCPCGMVCGLIFIRELTI